MNQVWYLKKDVHNVHLEQGQVTALEPIVETMAAPSRLQASDRDGHTSADNFDGQVDNYLSMTEAPIAT